MPKTSERPKSVARVQQKDHQDNYGANGLAILICTPPGTVTPHFKGGHRKSWTLTVWNYTDTGIRRFLAAGH